MLLERGVQWHQITSTVSNLKQAGEYIAVHYIMHYIMHTIYVWNVIEYF